MIECRRCKKRINKTDIVKSKSYWYKVKDIFSHKECETKEVYQEEAYECQKIDADCNDCGYFKRGNIVQHGIASIWNGVCNKFNKDVKAYPNFCSGHECFVHRKDI